MNDATAVLFVGQYGDLTLYPFDLTGPVEDVKPDVDLDDLTTGESITVNGQVCEAVIEDELSDMEGYDCAWDELSEDARTVLELYLDGMAAKAKRHAADVDAHLYGGK